MLLTLRIFAIDNLSQRLVHRQRKDVLVDFRTILHLLAEERILLEELGFTQGVGRDVIQGQRQFLIYIIVIMILLLQVVQFLAGHHLLHQLHRRIVLSRIALTLWLDHHFIQQIVRRGHFYRQLLGVLVNRHSLGVISHRRKGQCLPFRKLIHLKTAIDIRDGSYPFTFIKDIGIRNGLAGLCILQNAIDLSKELVESHQK